MTSKKHHHADNQPDDAAYFSRQWLLATPGMSDSIFAESVIYLCAHDKNGAMGFVLNEPASFTLDRVFAKFDVNVEVADIRNNVVLRGGPVSIEQGFVLHDGSTQWRGSKRLTPTIVLSPGRDVLEAIALGHDDAPTNYQVVFGYAGWSAGQLEEEIADNSWLTSDLRHEQSIATEMDLDHHLILNHPIESRWQQVGYNTGINMSRLSWQFGHA